MPGAWDLTAGCFSPLLSGLDPGIAWQNLRLLEAGVAPAEITGPGSPVIAVGGKTIAGYCGHSIRKITGNYQFKGQLRSLLGRTF